MRFRVIDNKTGKEADPYEIALHEEWAQGVIYCDVEGFAITEDGNLVLMDECGHVVYCDTERFKVVIENERPHGEWGEVFEHLGVKYHKCMACHTGIKVDSTYHNFCPSCGADMRPRILDEADDGAGKDGNVKEGETDIQKAWRTGFEKR